jgi:hypothetical protein
MTYLPFLLLVFFLIVLKETYLDIKNTKFQLGIERTVFEIKIPKEITKTPLAMELVLSALHNTSGESTWFDRMFLGKRRAHMSLEIVSTEGKIKFYIWAPKKFSKVIESAFYSQYPSVQIIEVLDYTKFYGFDPEKQGMFGVEYKLAKANPYPIKTYKDFGLDKPGLKPEEIVDPISHILEVMGNIGEGENMWMQMVIRAQKKDIDGGYLSLFDIFKKRELKGDVDWRTEAEEIIAKLRDIKNSDEEGVKRLDSDSEKAVIDAIADNISKPSFWTGIRSIYFSEGDSFDANNITALTNIFNTVKSETLNNLNAGGFTTSFDYPWNDYKDIRINKIKKEVFDDYKRRRYFNGGKKINPHFFLPFLDQMKKYNDFILSTEELATIFHLPSTVVSVPTFNREESKRGEAPSNLPF